MTSPSYTEDLLEKIRTLPDDKIAEVADFVESVPRRHRDTVLDEVADHFIKLHALSRAWLSLGNQRRWSWTRSLP